MQLPTSVGSSNCLSPRGPLAVGARILALLACALPPMISAVLPPATEVIHQVAALATWAGLAMALCLSFPRHSLSMAPGAPIFLAVFLLAAGITWSVWWTQLPMSLALMAYGALVAATMLFVFGLAVRQHGCTRPLLTLLAKGWVVLGVLIAGVCFIQVFAPQWADGDWIARSSLPGRAIGNMRQPNHTAILLCLSCISALWLSASAQLGKCWARLLMAIFVSAVVLTASRTGMAGIMILAVWGGWDKKLPTPTRRELLCAPLLLAVSWLLTQAWANWMHQGLGATQRLTEGASSPARTKIWADAVEMLLQHPWSGVGWGEFNLAWTLSDFPRRSVVAFDHVHNLPLQLLVELGLPLGLAVLSALCWGLIRARQSIRDAQGHDAIALRFAAMMLIQVGLHSMLEYPLWYMYFLMPCALLLGLCVGQPPEGLQRKHVLAFMPMRTLAYANAWVIAASAAMFADYLRVATLYEPNQLPMPEQMERSQQAWLFGTWADYIYAVHLSGTKQGLLAAQRAAHLVIDTRLLMAWAESLHAAGDADRAIFLSQRVRDFYDPQTEAWFAQCRAAGSFAQSKPFQCEAESKSFTYRDFL